MDAGSRLRILRVFKKISDTSAPYNQFSLPLADHQAITLCTFRSPELEPPQSLRTLSAGDSLRSFLSNLNAELASEQHDIVHVHSPTLGVWVLLATFWRRRRLPPMLITIHNSYPSFRLRNRLLHLVNFAGFDRIVVCGQSALESFPRLYRWLGGRRLTSVTNCVDLERLSAEAPESGGAPDSAARRNGFTVTTIAKLKPIKNLPVLLRAFAAEAEGDWRLILIGDGPLADRLVAEAQRLGISDRLDLRGLIPRDQVYAELRCSDVFVSLARGEGLPIAVLEAMACGLPVVLSDIPPHREIAAGAGCVRLVAAGDERAASAEIARLAAMPPGERRDVGRDCAEHVAAHFGLDAMHRGYERLYRELVERTGAE